MHIKTTIYGNDYIRIYRKTAEVKPEHNDGYVRIAGRVFNWNTDIMRESPESKNKSSI